MKTHIAFRWHHVWWDLESCNSTSYKLASLATLVWPRPCNSALPTINLPINVHQYGRAILFLICPVLSMLIKSGTHCNAIKSNPTNITRYAHKYNCVWCKTHKTLRLGLKHKADKNAQVRKIGNSEAALLSVRVRAWIKDVSVSKCVRLCLLFIEWLWLCREAAANRRAEDKTARARCTLRSLLKRWSARVRVTALPIGHACNGALLKLHDVAGQGARLVRKYVLHLVRNESKRHFFRNKL